MLYRWIYSPDRWKCSSGSSIPDSLGLSYLKVIYAHIADTFHIGETFAKNIGDSAFIDRYFSIQIINNNSKCCLLYTSPSPRDKRQSRMPSSA